MIKAKHVRAADVDERINPDPPFRVEVGKRYGDLVVICETTHSKGRPRRFIVRCLKEVDGRICGKRDVKIAPHLKGPRMRACGDCCKAYRDESRYAYGRSNIFARLGD